MTGEPAPPSDELIRITEEVLLSCQGVEKRFGGVAALGGVDLEIRAGKVLALMGENGAGKSTLISILSGSLSPDAGTIRAGGRQRAGLTPTEALGLGICAIRQEPMLVAQLSVMENLLLGRERRTLGFVRWRDSADRAASWLARVGATFSAQVKVGELRPADRQLVEIARAVGAGARVLFFDEPSACLTPREVGRLYQLIRSLTADGAGVVYVSHRLNEVLDITDDVVVLRDGHLVASGATADFDERSLARAMAGRDLPQPTPRARPAATDAVLALDGVHSGTLHGAQLELRAGEIHGIAGIVGSGRSRLARVIAGAERVQRGTMRLDGHGYAPRTPRDAIRAGVVMVPEDRVKEALFSELTQATNVLFGRMPSAGPGLLTRRAEAAVAAPMLERLDVRPRRARIVGRQLSGGNQQKLVLGRALHLQPRVLVLDEPTRGVDVGAKADIHRAIRERAESGAAVLVISSDLTELMSLCDRITVVARGHTVARFDAPFDPTDLMTAATGGDRSAP